MKILITGGSGFIGTNLIEYYLNKGVQIMNIDINKPKIQKHYSYWKECDIRDIEKLTVTVNLFEPDYLIHLASRANLSGKTLEDYSTNIIGVENIIKISNKINSIKKVIFASTMLVCKVGYQPKNENDYFATTIYGKSKIIGEKLVKNTTNKFDWVIIRPTSIWGPWFGPTYSKFIEMISKKLYFNFGGGMSVKIYGYIGNTVYLINELLLNSKSNMKTLYIGDYEPIKINEWANEIGDLLKIKIFTIPRFVILLAAYFGDLMMKIGINFPMNRFRFKNMTTDNIIDISQTRKLVSDLPYTRQEGNKLTIEWMKQHNIIS